jgi:hypothetical protein
VGGEDRERALCEPSDSRNLERFSVGGAAQEGDECGSCRLAAPVTEKRIGLSRYLGRSPMGIERAQRASEVSAVGAAMMWAGSEPWLRAMTGGDERENATREGQGCGVDVRKRHEARHGQWRE